MQQNFSSHALPPGRAEVPRLNALLIPLSHVDHLSLDLLPPDTTSFSPRNPLPGGGKTPEGARMGPEKPRRQALSILIRHVIPEPDHA